MKNQFNPKIITLQKKRKKNSKDILQLSVTVIMKNTRQQREHVENPDD